MLISSPISHTSYTAPNIQFEGILSRRKKESQKFPEYHWRAIPYRVEKLKRSGPYGMLNLREVNQVFLQDQLRELNTWPMFKKKQEEIRKDISRLQFRSALYDELLIETLKEASLSTIIDFQHKRSKRLNGQLVFSMPLPPEALAVIKQKLEEAKKTPETARLLEVMPGVPDTVDPPEKKVPSFKKAAAIVVGTLVAEKAVKAWFKSKFP